MWIYFDTNGIVTTRITTDMAIRQGDVGDWLFAYFEGVNLTNRSATIQILKPSGFVMPEVYMNSSTKVYSLSTNGDFIQTQSYVGKEYTFSDNTFFDEYGQYSATIRLYNTNGTTIMVQGLIKFWVELSTNYAPVQSITLTQYQALISSIGAKPGYGNVIRVIGAGESLPTTGEMAFSNVTNSYPLHGRMYAITNDLGHTTMYVVVEDELKIVEIQTNNAVFYGKASESITKGDVIQYAGVQGDHVLIKKARPSEINAFPQLIIGLATESCLVNEFTSIIYQGELHNVATQSLKTIADGLAGGSDSNRILYFDSSSNDFGKLTPIEPTAANKAKVIIAIVEKWATGQASNGEMWVRLTFDGGRNTINIKVQDAQPTDQNNGDLWYDLIA
jgi:hypothetical protein